MKNPTPVGIDVGARELVVALGGEQRCFTNDESGHRALMRLLAQRGRKTRVVLESTGIYHLDLALALHAHPHIQVMVANPRTVRDFARARLQRSKTDKTDARTLEAFAAIMEFQPWVPPSAEALALRALSRRIAALTGTLAQERNRLHAARDPLIRADVREHLAQLRERIRGLVHHAVEQIHQADPLRRAYCHLVSVKGIATASAVRILGELAVLPADMSAREWVAHCGLDPRHEQSGTSICKPARISKVGNRHLRASLYMPALVAARFEPRIAAYYQALLARGKKPLQALVAVMRKLLHSIHAMLAQDVDFDPARFYPARG
jgi:transposase